MATIETLIDQCTAWAKKNLSPDFEFRKYQLESCVSIVNNVLDNVKTQVMNAPTGSGKSLTSMIAAGVLYEYYQKKSYILISDVSLFDQYVADLQKYNLDWGYIKGKDNYTCAKNSNIVSCGECALQQVSFKELSDPMLAKKRGFLCTENCKYIQEKIKAIKSPITVMTYQLFLIQRNYVAEMMEALGGEAIFEERDFVICDEAHKLPDIIQSHFAPQMTLKPVEWMKTLNSYAQKNGLPTQNIKDAIAIANQIKNINDKQRQYELLCKYEKIIAGFLELNECIREEAKKNKNYKSLFRQLAAGNIARECHCKFDDYIRLIENVGVEAIVITDSDDTVVANCVYEGTMVDRYFHKRNNCELMMSATIGSFRTYRKLIGSDKTKPHDYHCLDIPSTFDFSQSPIYYSEQNPMSFKEKATSIGPICKQIIDICNNNKGVRGIIQTGNYENCSKLMDRVPADLKKRIILYNNAHEKIHALEKFERTSDGILVGPTLLEGLNFTGDLCRFNICMKLPYASLGSKLVSAKMKLIPEWYNYDCCCKLIQGIGRGVRYDGDWCVTYILDGCFNNILKYGSSDINDEIKKRLVKI